MRRWLVGVARVAIGALFAMPLYWVFVVATGRRGTAYQLPPAWLPGLHWAPMLYVLEHTRWLQYLANSVFISATTIVLVLATSALAGYALAEYRFRGREAIFLLLLGSMMLPGQALLIPQFLVLYHLHMLNTYQALIVPFAASGSGVFLFRQFFLRLPPSYREVALLEGASTLRYLWRVAIPLARPAVATVALLTFIGSWNQFQWPLIMTSSHHVQPLEVALSHYMQAFEANWRKLSSAALLALVPIAAVYALTQRYIVNAVQGDTGLSE